MNAEFHQLRVLFCFSKFWIFKIRDSFFKNWSWISRFSIFFEKRKKWDLGEPALGGCRERKEGDKDSLALAKLLVLVYLYLRFPLSFGITFWFPLALFLLLALACLAAFVWFLFLVLALTLALGFGSCLCFFSAGLDLRLCLSGFYLCC